MQINLEFKKSLMQIIFYLITSIHDAKAQRTDLKCSLYKKLIFEETKTFSYFLPDATETSFIEDHCTAAGGFVVGGENANPKEFPFAARLGHMTGKGPINWFCGGTLISENFVLTAAHCFHPVQGVLNRVRLGELITNSDPDKARHEDFDVKRLIKHPDYNSTLPYNDIGLVMLRSSVKLDRFKHPACLPPPHLSLKENSLIAIGWGDMKYSVESSSHLQKVTLKFYSHEECKWIVEGKQQFPDGLKDSQICAGSTEVKDTCRGDSGGPLLVRHTNYPCMFNVIGITSLGILGDCGIPNIPGIYTNVAYFVDWISENVFEMK